jgi:hypothetical protein
MGIFFLLLTEQIMIIARFKRSGKAAHCIAPKKPEKLLKFA